VLCVRRLSVCKFKFYFLLVAKVKSLLLLFGLEWAFLPAKIPPFGNRTWDQREREERTRLEGRGDHDHQFIG